MNFCDQKKCLLTLGLILSISFNFLFIYGLYKSGVTPSSVIDSINPFLEKSKSKRAQLEKEPILQKKRIKNPLVVILGCINYDISPKYNSLPGTRSELEKTQKLFEEVYGYKVISSYVKNEPSSWSFTRKRMLAFCKEQQKYLKEHHHEHDGLIFVYSGHGEDGTLLASDGKLLSIQKVKTLFNLENIPEMVNKPKIFIFSKCRGRNWIQPVQINGSAYHPEKDFMEFYGNSLDHQIFDNPPDGGFLIDAFTSALTKNSHVKNYSLVNIFKSISPKVQEASKQKELVVQEIKTDYELFLDAQPKKKSHKPAL